MPTYPSFGVATPPDQLPADSNKGPLLIIVTAILVSLSVIMTTLRCWVRRVNRQLRWDDYLIVIATLLAIGRLGIQIAAVKHGNGRHIWYLTKQQYEWIVMSDFYTQLLLFPALCFLKISICLLLLRTFSTVVIKGWLYLMMAGLVITSLEPCIVLLAECRPIRATWKPLAGICWSSDVRIYSIWVQLGLLCPLLQIRS